jgi:pimeloyl-ACP methyl ester carboxylesterase
MSNQRTHYVTTSDGVTIGGTVHGQGPALVFLQGAVGDGDLDWQRVLPYLTDRYTCHLPSMRGRGLSGDHADLRTSRILEDYATYVDSIGEPVGLTGWSGGGYFALGVAVSRPDAVAVVAPFEPGFLTLADEAEQVVAGAAPHPYGRTRSRRQAGSCRSRVCSLALHRRRHLRSGGRRLPQCRRSLRPESAQPAPAGDGGG